MINLKELRLSVLSSTALSSLTFLDQSSDPYRCDAPASVAGANWIAAIYNSEHWPDRPIHPRGIHYLLASIGGLIRPNGMPYDNSDDAYKWLKNKALTAARWHGLIPFDAISDERNDDPIILRANSDETGRAIHHLSDFAVPEVDDIFPQAKAIGASSWSGPRPRQPVRIVLMGEKTSLRFVFEKVAKRRQADIFLASGNVSNTLMSQLAASIEEDGRPTLILFIGDADPNGHNMPLEVGRKLQALADMLYPSIRFAVKRVGLTVDQALALDLPPVPMKASESRAGVWFERFGVEHQYELDALATIRPEVLERWLEAEIAPYYDRSLGRRLAEAVWEYEAAEQQRLDEALGLGPYLQRRAAEAVADLAAIREEIEAAMENVGDPTPFIPPVAEVEGDFDTIDDTLIHSSDSWEASTRRLIEDKIKKPTK